MTPAATTGIADSRKRFEERVDPRTGEKYRAVFARGEALKVDPLLNKGTCFTLDERDAFGLRGILPPAVSSPDEQARRAYENYLNAGDDVSRYVFLAALQDRNETLFYRLLVDHLEEMVPIIYTPTVGRICEQYSHLYRRPRGLYVSSQDRGRVAEVLANAERGPAEVIVVTDNEAILGIGDQGIGGMGIAIGKLALYTAGAGIHPGHSLPLTVDVGTDNQALLQDPLYLGVRHARLRGDAYFSLLDELVGAIAEVFPGAIVQWEDFASHRAFEVLRRYRRRLPSFDDDIQGTGAVVEAGVRTALARIGRRLADERVVFYGAGASGAGCALQIRRALAAEGASQPQLSQRVLCLDSRGLILEDRAGLTGYKAEIAADPSIVGGWTPGSDGSFRLLDVVRQFRPTILVGVSGQPGAFTEEIVRTMLGGCDRPIILALSNPTPKVEATPADLLRWTNGAAVVGTGSPFPPVRLNDVVYRIGQCNNALVFPGIGLGARVVGARWLPDDVFAAAARAVHEFAGSDTQPGASIYPPISRLREVSRDVAVAVARAIVDTGEVPALTTDEIEDRVAAAMWEPVYRPYRVA
ncbi:MAG TPA: NAD-dependent malic enzyme [Vicinamibacterales bacterium]|nr:NAD-dependent malic enzyme [Vicinamibacterales bacterium]